MKTISVQDSRLWDAQWRGMSTEEKLEALRETLFEITTELREIGTEIDYDEIKAEFKSDLEILEHKLNVRIDDLAKRSKIE